MAPNRAIEEQEMSFEQERRAKKMKDALDQVKSVSSSGGQRLSARKPIERGVNQSAAAAASAADQHIV